MAIVGTDVISRYMSWWEGKNTGALLGISYNKNGIRKSAAEAGLLKPWMNGRGEWIFARSVMHAYAVEDMSPVSDALDIMEHDLSQEAYAGVGFPSLFLNTGAGCASAFITEYSNYYNNTVWFELEKPWDYDKILALKEDHTTRFAETTLEAVTMAAKRLKGQAVLSPLDLGGLADILSSLRRTDRFLYDMLDQPDDVKEALCIIQKIWKRIHDRMTAILEPANNGLYTSWTRVLSDSLYYPSQCDACAMISPDMFKEFILPTLSDEFSYYKRALYHLDGSGEIPHVGMICEHPQVRAIQWVPEPTKSHSDDSYLPLYEKIISYGKKIVINGYRGDMESLKQFLDRMPKEAFLITMGAETYDEAMRLEEIQGV